MVARFYDRDDYADGGRSCVRSARSVDPVVGSGAYRSVGDGLAHDVAIAEI